MSKKSVFCVAQNESQVPGIVNPPPERQTSSPEASIASRAATILLGLSLCSGAFTLTCGLTGCAGSQYERSTGEHIDDRSTSSRVKKSLGEDPQYKFENVNVTTFKGVVQLSGFVNTGEQKSRAGDLAKHTTGVHEVENNITVKQ
jgi:hyperosmotically inducible protein